MLHRGGCHCGAVTFEVEADLERVIACNCSHCSKKGYCLAFVPREALTVTRGGGDLATSPFNTHTIRHRFCRTFGCAPFGEGASPRASRWRRLTCAASRASSPPASPSSRWTDAAPERSVPL
jgi:hypothetical protein